MEKDKLWKSITGELELYLSPMYFSTFFPGTKVLEVDDQKKELTIECPSTISRDTIKSKFSQQIEEIIKNKTGVEYRTIYITHTNDQDETQNTLPLFKTPIITEQVENRQTSSENRTKGLIKEYTFDKFIVGPNNRLAFTVAKSIAENPGSTYNPYLIYSGVGLGKTHLLHAIGNEIAKNFPNLKILYCTGQDFLNELMEELQSYRGKGGTLGRFKNKFTSNDVWLIDDVQHIAGKDSTQEEFYFAFNSLYLNKKQIVLSTDRHPSEIPKLQDRISSRFRMGMIADIQAPDVDIRTAILRNKRDQMRVEIDNSTIDFIATNINSNIRELEGAFIQVVTFAKAMGMEADIDCVKQALSKTLISKHERNVRPTTVISQVAKFYNLEIKEIKGKNRTKHLVIPRHICMYLLKELNQLTLVEIGGILGGRDHTTVMHGTDKIRQEVAKGNFKIQKEIATIKENILVAE